MVLWVNLVVASTLTIPLGVEPKHDDVLALPAAPASEDIINWRAAGGSASARRSRRCACCVFAYFLETSTTLHAQTVTFTTLVALEWATAIGSRSWTVPWYWLRSPTAV